MNGIFFTRVAISATATLLIIFHLFVPKISVDAITLGLLVAGVVPWLSSIFKGLEFPGGWKIEFQELKEITERARSANLLSDDDGAAYSFELVAEHDPNLALAGIRIELERKLRELAGHDSTYRPVGIGNLTRTLHKNGALTNTQASLINDLAPMLNQAAHGATIDSRGSDWAITVAPRILNALRSSNHLK